MLFLLGVLFLIFVFVVYCCISGIVDVLLLVEIKLLVFWERLEKEGELIGILLSVEICCFDL